MRARSHTPGGLGLGALVCSVMAVRALPALADDHDVVFALGQTQLHKRPGEAAPVVGHADPGDELEVVGDQGRWLEVRNGKQVGWVTRTEVAAAKPAEPRKRPERSGFSGKRVTDALKVTIEIDHVRGFDDPRFKARNVLDLVRGDVVTVIGRGHDGWILVEQEEGGVGWIPASVVKDAGKFTGDPRRAPAELLQVQAAPAAAATMPVTDAAGPVEPSAGRPWLAGTLLATAGAQTFQMRQSGDGRGTAIATGELARITAGAQLRVRGDLWVGLETTAELGTADLTYYGQAEPSAAMPTRERAVDACAELALGRMPHLAARAGVHYATFSVKPDRAEAMLIGERLAGVTGGLGGSLPIGRRLSLSAVADVMPVGSQRLSRAPPGTLYATTVRGAWARGTLTMPLPAHLVAALSYRFGIVTAQLTDDGSIPKTARRTDQSHVVTAGIGVTW
jgi:hypothetical protein